MPLDLLGNGTACLVWSSPLADNARRPMRYIDLMGGQKPHLLVHVTNNLGAETIVQYVPSTKFYVADKLAGTPWLTRLPFPVHVVERVETYDYISRNRFVTRYAYHHGYFDGVEREFRGFGRVDQLDTEEFATLSSASNFPQATNEDPSSNCATRLDEDLVSHRRFFRGILISKHLEQEYYSEGDSSDAIAGLTPAQLESMLLDDTVLPTDILLSDGSRIPYDLSGEEMREACRALRGSILRQEIYALDNTDESDRPYSVSERNYTIEILQPRAPNRYGVFFAHPRETIDFHYERKLYKVVGNTLVDQNAPPPNAKNAADPRVTHAHHAGGRSLWKRVAVRGRRVRAPIPGSRAHARGPIQAEHDAEHLHARISTPMRYSADDAYRAPLPAQSSTYELIQVQPVGRLSRKSPICSVLTKCKPKFRQASDGAHEILYENLDPTGLNAGEPYRRLIETHANLLSPGRYGRRCGRSQGSCWHWRNWSLWRCRETATNLPSLQD